MPAHQHPSRHHRWLKTLADASIATTRRFRRDTNGATAIEFAIVLGPFLAFTFGIITIGLHYLATNSIDKALFDASRQIRTGQAQKSNMSSQDFKALVCEKAQPHIDCNRLEIHLASFDSWKDVVPPNCVDGASNLASGGNNSDPVASKVGGASKKVLVTACYDWIIGKYLPYVISDENGDRRTASPLASGGVLMQSLAIFQTEPYE